VVCSAAENFPVLAADFSSTVYLT
jgi:hypothetical protein